LVCRWARIFSIGFFCLAWQASPSFSLETDRAFGEASYQFLKLPLSPRITALSGAGIAIWDGAGEAESNPASIADDKSKVILGYGFPFSTFGAKASHLGWNVPLESGRLWLGARYLGYDKISGHSELDEETSAYGAHTWKAQIGYATTWHGLKMGLALGFAQNHIAEASYETALANVGLRYALWRGLTVGAAVTQADIWSSDAYFDGNASPFPPTTVQAGLAYQQSLFKDWSAALAVDARTRNDETLTFPLGFEGSWREMVSLRAGYSMAAKEAGLTAGLGLAWSHFKVQYAFEGHAELDAGHYLSLEIAY
jgi:hypothetical protein